MALGGPYEWMVLFCEFCERSGDGSIIWYERSLISWDSEDASNFLYFVQGPGPVLQSLGFGGSMANLFPSMIKPTGLFENAL